MELLKLLSRSLALGTIFAWPVNRGSRCARLKSILTGLDPQPPFHYCWPRAKFLRVPKNPTSSVTRSSKYDKSMLASVELSSSKNLATRSAVHLGFSSAVGMVRISTEPASYQELTDPMTSFRNNVELKI